MKDKKYPPSDQFESNGSAERKTPPKKKKKKHSKPFLIFKKLLTVIATTLLSLTLVCIITGTIVTTALTVYVLNFMDDSTSVTIQELEAGSDTNFYGEKINQNTGEIELAIIHTVPNQINRIPVDIERIPQHVRNAFVYTEDERFYVHDGVDYKRTFSAFANMFLHFYDTEQGGSTITQQLVKNLTGDKEHTPQRKIREIFSAMQLEKTYSKDEILEEYLNYISFGGPRNGIQKASIDYFGKSVENLTVPEAAVLAAIPKSPEDYGPFVIYRQDDNDLSSPIVVDGKANNKPRQEYVLYKLYENGAITYDEYQKYIVTPLIFTDSEEYKKAHPEQEAAELEEKESSYSWIVDATYFEAVEIFMEKFDLDYDKAMEKLQKGGYKVYTTYSAKMQNYVEEKLLDINNMIPEWQVRKYADIAPVDGVAEEYLPHIAFVAMNYDGEVLCAVGDIGPKVGSLGTNYAVRKADGRQVGSTIKPITNYGYGIETGDICWGSPIKDYGIPVGENGSIWPFNYGRVSGTGNSLPVYYALQKSYNTAPAQLCWKYTPETIFKFATEKLGLDLVPADKDYAPLVIGALHEGITLENLVNAYLPYGNRGIYNEAHIISRIEDSTQQIIYQNNGNPRQAVSDETAWVMNRLLKNVVENGTGTAARLSNKVVVGKTGTTEDWYDECFVGLTRDFASGMTMGYKYNNDNLNLNGVVSAQIWQNIIGAYANSEYPDTPSDFDAVKSVIEAPMCTATNQIAGQYCGKGAIGYWKSEQTETYSPPYCSGAHGYSNSQSGNSTGNSSNGGAATGGDTTGGTATGGTATGGAATGGDATGGAATGGAATGGDATGGYTGGGDATGGYTGGGDATGGAATGGDATGGYTGGGDAAGGAATGGDAAGGV